MCGRYTLTDPGDLLKELDVAAPPEPLAPRFNISPTQKVPVVRTGAEGQREVTLMRWGLVPFWAKDLAIGNKMINARSETVAEKPSYKRPLERSRCLVLADGFYEWAKTESGKQPFFIHLNGRKPFVMAGLWDRWTKGDEPVESFTILTTDANEKIRPLHNRMPVIVPAAERDAWLDPELRDKERLVQILKPYPDDEIDYYTVSKRVNAPVNDRPDMVLPLEPERGQ